MCFKEVLDRLATEGLSVTPTQLRWAVTSGKVSRPPLDGSLRFNFSAEHLRELLDHFRAVSAEPSGGRR